MIFSQENLLKIKNGLKTQTRRLWYFGRQVTQNTFQDARRMVFKKSKNDLTIFIKNGILSLGMEKSG